MRYLLAAIVVAGCAMAFGVPDVPDVPEADLSEIEIPGMELLDDVQVKLDDIISETDTLRTLIPDLAVLDDLSVKLEELRDTDPELAGIQAEINELRGELENARAQITEVSDRIDEEVGTIRDTVNDFTAGLPGQ